MMHEGDGERRWVVHTRAVTLQHKKLLGSQSQSSSSHRGGFGSHCHYSLLPLPFDATNFPVFVGSLE
jgi:hypothetical protein